MTATDDQDRADFHKALRSATPQKTLTVEIRRRLVDESARPMLVSVLQAFALELRQEGREADEEVVLDVLDGLTGFCSPQARIDPPR